MCWGRKTQLHKVAFITYFNILWQQGQMIFYSCFCLGTGYSVLIPEVSSWKWTLKAYASSEMLQLTLVSFVMQDTCLYLHPVIVLPSLTTWESFALLLSVEFKVSIENVMQTKWPEKKVCKFKTSTHWPSAEVNVSVSPRNCNSIVWATPNPNTYLNQIHQHWCLQMPELMQHFGIFQKICVSYFHEYQQSTL